MNTLSNNVHAKVQKLIFFTCRKRYFEAQNLLHKIGLVSLFCGMLIKPTHCTVKGTSDLRDLVVANSTFLSQELSCRLPRNQSVSSLTVMLCKYTIPSGHLGYAGKTDLSHHYATELKKLRHSYICENKPTIKSKDLHSSWD